MTYEVQQTRWDRIIRRVSGSIGPGSRVSETISELFPMIDVENVPAELLILGGTRLAFGGGIVAAVAAEVSKAQLFNPVDSGHLITVTSAYLAPATGSIAIWGIGIIQFGALIGTQTFRDTRSLAPSLPVGSISQDTAVASVAATNQARVLANSTFKIEDPNALAVLAPGSGFEMGLATANVGLAYSFHWRERPAEESELNL